MNKTKRTLLKYGGLAWVTPVVTSVSLPAHAQTSGISCLDPRLDLLNYDLLGVWNFTDSNGLKFEVDFFEQEDDKYEFDFIADDAEAYYGRGSRTTGSGSLQMGFDVYGNGSNNDMYLDGDITSFTDCVALEITITDIQSNLNPRGYVAPIIGVRSS